MYKCIKLEKFKCRQVEIKNIEIQKFRNGVVYNSKLV